jgi:hypothetical protein
VQKKLRKATICDASLCSDTDRAAGTLGFAISERDDGWSWNGFATEPMDLTVR